MVDTLELRLLGPLMVLRNGAPAAIGGVKPRQLLATLALHHGRTVSIDHLIEVLWPHDPPRSAHANIQTYVSAVRAKLGEDRVRRQAPGYRLEATAAELDLLRFEQDGSGPEAALALWRGEPLEDLPHSPLWTVHIGQLTERRRMLRQEQARIWIDAGQARTAVMDLRALVAEEPLREEAWALLVTALRAAGSRAEALSVYARARRTLTEELGVEPGEPLQSLHRTLLMESSDGGGIEPTGAGPRESGEGVDSADDDVVGRGLLQSAALPLGGGRLDSDAALVLRGLALLPGGPVLDWVAAALLDRGDATGVLTTLHSGRLIRLEGPDALGRQRYSLPTLVGLLAPDLPGTAVDAALVRVLEGYLELTRKAATALPPQVFGPGPSHPAGTALRWRVPDAARITGDAVGWFMTERANLVGAVELAARIERTDLAWKVAHALVAWYDLGGRMEDWDQTHRTALAACRASGDLLGEAVILRGLGQLHLYQDRYADAADAFSRGRLLFARCGDVCGEAAALAGLGTVHRVRGEFDEAHSYYQRTLAAYRGLGHRHGEAYAHGVLGMVHLARNELDRARGWFRTGLRIAEEVGDLHRYALLTRQLGVVELRGGNDVLARTAFATALDRFASLGDAHCEAYCLTDSAGLYPPETAVIKLTAALEIFERIGDREGQAQTARRLGELHRDVGRSGLGDAFLAEAIRLTATGEPRTPVATSS
jgi:DNA-binding SARP family transcriptional activator/tetratricopeptide (TPR) repeat protein